MNGALHQLFVGFIPDCIPAIDDEHQLECSLVLAIASPEVQTFHAKCMSLVRYTVRFVRQSDPHPLRFEVLAGEDYKLLGAVIEWRYCNSLARCLGNILDQYHHLVPLIDDQKIKFEAKRANNDHTQNILDAQTSEAVRVHQLADQMECLVYLAGLHDTLQEIRHIEKTVEYRNTSFVEHMRVTTVLQQMVALCSHG